MFDLHNGTTLQIAMLVAILWALAPIIQKMAFRTISWKMLIAINAVVQLCIVFIVVVFYKDQFLQEWNTTDLTVGITYSVILSIMSLSAAAFYFYILSTRKTFDVILLTSSYFVIAILLNAIIFQQPLTAKQIIATFLVFLGVLLTIENQD
jgi:uncharacterized membrane protein